MSRNLCSSRPRFYCGPEPPVIPKPKCACGCGFEHGYKTFAIKDNFVYWLYDEGHRAAWEGQYSLKLEGGSNAVSRP